jgi:hypothetical protein
MAATTPVIQGNPTVPPSAGVGCLDPPSASYWTRSAEAIFATMTVIPVRFTPEGWAPERSADRARC